MAGVERATLINKKDISITSALMSEVIPGHITIGAAPTSNSNIGNSGGGVTPEEFKELKEAM